jgi:TRAP-type mannitol/chloroaromatic compound transport system permease large subunit
MPPLPAAERAVPLPPALQRLSTKGRHAFAGLLRAVGGDSAGVPKRTVLGQLVVTLLPLLVVGALLGLMYDLATRQAVEVSTAGLELGTNAEVKEDTTSTGLASPQESAGGLQEPPAEGGLQEPPKEGGLQEPAPEKGAAAAGELAEPTPERGSAAAEPQKADPAAPAATAKAAEPAAAELERLPVPRWLWITAGIAAFVLLVLYALWTWDRLQIFKLLLTSFFPLAILILLVLGSIVFGFATPTEAAAVGAFGGFMLAVAYRATEHWRAAPAGSKGRAVATTGVEVGRILKESSFLTAKTSAMVCWLFIGSAIFSAAFALLGGQDLVEKWVLSLNLTPLQFMILAQFIIFILGWPLEWTEIIVIFMPIFIPLLPHFNIDPLFFGLLVALNLQTAFLSPPVAMAAFYLKGVAPPHVTLNQIFAGMMPFMAIQVVALVLLYMYPGIGLWLPQVLYSR